MAGNATMRALALIGQAYNISVLTVPRPTLQNDTDAIIRVTASAICGSDLHFYHAGLGSPEHPHMMGHEAMGYISEAGPGVNSLGVGDYVVIPDNDDDGHFTRGLTLPNSFGAGGELSGCQAEYVRVPNADDTLIPVNVNASTNRTRAYDYLFVSDIFATGWTALDFSGFQAGDSVAIFGAGPMGLLSAYSAMLRGASRVYSIDHVPARLDVAASIGAIPINFNETDPVERIMALEPGGVTRAVDCVGYESVNRQGVTQAGIVPTWMLGVTAQRGGVGIAGIYENGANISTGEIWGKGLTIGSGIVLPLEHATELLNLIDTGRAHTNFIVSSTIGIEQGPEYYTRFSNHQETKVVIEFP